MNRRILLLAPFGVALAAGGGFWEMLQGLRTGKFNPRGVPSMLIGKRVPAFDLPGFSDRDLVTGKPLLVNFFASWCVPCVEEHPVLMDLKQQGTPVWGIAYKDKPAATDALLAQRGDPYFRLARDEAGRAAIDWGITGVPESFLIDGQGIVRWHIALPLTPETVDQELMPLWRKVA
jgi:cytochrome c biogenesis protein CcmG/thiol:disulfide interchange protein DsbE